MCDSDRIQAGGLVMKADNNSAGIDRNSKTYRENNTGNPEGRRTGAAGWSGNKTGSRI